MLANRVKQNAGGSVDADDGARIVYGHTAPSREALEAAVNAGAWDELLLYHQTKPGDFWFVPAGKLHALGAGTMVLEVQQSSNTTYRVYDYDRRDAAGNKRELHLADALNVTTVPDNSPVALTTWSSGSSGTSCGLSSTASGLSNGSAGASSTDAAEQALLADCPYFRVEYMRGHDLAARDITLVQAVAVVSGSGSLRDEHTGEETMMQRGDITLLPAGARVSFSGTAEVIVTTVPTD